MALYQLAEKYWIPSEIIVAFCMIRGKYYILVYVIFLWGLILNHVGLSLANYFKVCCIGLTIIDLFFFHCLLLSRSLLLISGSFHPNLDPTQFGLTVAHLNARSLCISDKFSEISALVSSHAFDIFSLFRKLGLMLIFQMISGYNSPLRKDRVDSRGGVCGYLYC